MPSLDAYRLSFSGGLHLGTRGLNLEEAGVHLPSDTLFAALVDAWRELGGNATAYGERYRQAPPYVLTSAFPFAGHVRFFPMPADLSRLFGERTLANDGKRIKRIRYLSETLFRLAFDGRRLDDYLFPAEDYVEPKAGIALQEGALWLAADEVSDLPQMWQSSRSSVRGLRYRQVWASARVPRVTVSRVESASNIFYAGRVRFAPECGLWFGVQWLDPDASVNAGGATFAEALREQLAVLQHAGLGGERAAGYGAFTCAGPDSLALPDPAPNRPGWLLSRYHPREDELPDALTGEGAAYTLASVAGWLRSPQSAAQRRKRIYLVNEGSIVCPPGFPAGDVADVRPTHENPDGDVSHPVYRCGLAVIAGISARQEAAHG
ncbi:MAG: type III-A CRISPR-associated RAMP protein Csm4 [Chloroflexota bacterium]|nr:type III-A CRISPR-associated RAMP protein Csm4 [Chloroflexota bacterium]